MSSANQETFHTLVSAHWKEDMQTTQRQKKKKSQNSGLICCCDFCGYGYMVMPPFIAVSAYMANVSFG